jgi:hypothetical protein
MKSVVTGFLGAILVTMALQVITPPNFSLTSRQDPYSLTGRLVWSTKFEIAAIAIGFLIGCLLGNIETRPNTHDPGDRKSFRFSR